MSHKDFTGKLLQEGDSVVFIRPKYRELLQGTVARFTDCYVVVEYIRDRRYSVEPDQLRQTGDQLIKV